MRKGLQKIATGVSQCTIEMTNYGACMNKLFDDVVYKSCDKEFLLFKECLKKNMKRTW